MSDTKTILKNLEQGLSDMFSSERYTEYLKTMSRFHRYSYGNITLILMQMPEATSVAGFNSWKNDFHRFVKKGEKSIKILAPCTKKVIQLDDEGNEVERIQKWFRPVSVFDISQTEGEPLPEIAKTLDGSVDSFPAIKYALHQISPVNIFFEDMQGNPANGYYSRAENKIVVKNTLPEAQTIKTMIHEIAHSMMHSQNEGKEASTKEVEAESVAYTVCNYLGIDSSDYSFGYIAGWSKQHDISDLKQSLNAIQRTADELINNINKICL